MRNMIKGCFAGILIISAVAPQTVHSQLPVKLQTSSGLFETAKHLSYPVPVKDGNLSQNLSLQQPQFQTEVLRLRAEQAEQAKVAAQQAAAQAQAAAVAPVEYASTPAVIYSTDHQTLMAEAGISPSDYQFVDFIVSRESGWNPDATNPTSGAHGLPQALPYSKTGCGWVDAVCQLQWANGYVAARYGGWYGAYLFWLSHSAY